MKKIHLDEKGNIVQSKVLVDVTSLKEAKLKKDTREIQDQRTQLMVQGIPEKDLPPLPTTADYDDLSIAKESLQKELHQIVEQVKKLKARAFEIKEILAMMDAAE